MHFQDTNTVTPPVLIAIDRQITLGVPGIVRMESTLGGMNRLIKRTSSTNSVGIQVEDNAAYINLCVDLEASSNMRDVCHEVTRNVEEAVGLDVVAIDVNFTSTSVEA